MDDIPKIGKNTEKRAGNRGLGRPRGSKNRIPASIKAMVKEALENAGGAAYLQRQAELNPSAFMSLIGRLIPQEIDASVEGTTYTGGIIAIPTPYKSVAEWRAAFNLDEPEQIGEGGSDGRIA